MPNKPVSYNFSLICFSQGVLTLTQTQNSPNTAMSIKGLDIVQVQIRKNKIKQKLIVLPPVDIARILKGTVTFPGRKIFFINIAH